MRGFGYDATVRIREYVDTDWPALWHIFQGVVTAGDTFAYDPGWSSKQARDVWVGAAPGHTVVACDGPWVLWTAKMGPNPSWAWLARLHGKLYGRRQRAGPGGRTRARRVRTLLGS